MFIGFIFNTGDSGEGIIQGHTIFGEDRKTVCDIIEEYILSHFSEEFSYSWIGDDFYPDGDVDYRHDYFSWGRVYEVNEYEITVFSEFA